MTQMREAILNAVEERMGRKLPVMGGDLALSELALLSRKYPIVQKVFDAACRAQLRQMIPGIQIIEWGGLSGSKHSRKMSSIVLFGPNRDPIYAFGDREKDFEDQCDEYITQWFKNQDGCDMHNLTPAQIRSVESHFEDVLTLVSIVLDYTREPGADRGEARVFLSEMQEELIDRDIQRERHEPVRRCVGG